MRKYKAPKTRAVSVEVTTVGGGKSYLPLCCTFRIIDAETGEPMDLRPVVIDDMLTCGVAGDQGAAIKVTRLPRRFPAPAAAPAAGTV